MSIPSRSMPSGGNPTPSDAPAGQLTCWLGCSGAVPLHQRRSQPQVSTADLKLNPSSLPPGSPYPYLSANQGAANMVWHDIEGVGNMEGAVKRVTRGRAEEDVQIEDDCDGEGTVGVSTYAG